MKKIIILVFLLFGINNVFAGGTIPKGCKLKGFNSDNVCGSIIIGKISSDINEIMDKELENNDYLEEGSFYITSNNYFFDKGFKKIYENILNKEGWLNLGQIKKGDVIIYDGRIFNYSNNSEDKKSEILEETYYKNKTGISNIIINNTYGSYYKIICTNDFIYLENKNSNYDLINGENNKVNKNILKNDLQKKIKTCSHFNKLFGIKEEKTIIETNLEKENKSWLEKIIDFILNIFK